MAGNLTFIEPCLATLAGSAPESGDWLHEIKFDGYRMQAQVADGKVRLLTRSGLDWTEKFGPELAAHLGALNCKTAILDGEVVVLDNAGASSFPRLQQALSDKATASLTYFLFDLMLLDGEDLRALPLTERKGRLATLLKTADAGPLRFSDHFTEPGAKMFRHVCQLGLEGIVSKRAASPYDSGRSGNWLKAKCIKRQEFVIVGYLPSEKTGRGLRSLLVGYHQDDRLRYGGRVGTGFTVKTGDALLKRLHPLEIAAPAFQGSYEKVLGTRWVRPELVAEVEYRAWTDDGILRHASYQGLREDKPAEDVVQEKPIDKKPAPKKTSAPKPAGDGGFVLTSPGKALWPDEGVTKKDLLDYYETVWPRMEPYVVNRPLSLVRAPDGILKQRFFQKHASAGMSSAILRAKDPETGDELLYIDSFDGLAALVQMGVVEVHIWGSTMDDIERPDQLIFDLDPDEGLSNADVIAATLDVRARLDEIGLPNFVKPSGGKGYHVLVPLKPSANWEVVKTFSHDFASAMEQSAPEKYTANLSKAARKGRIFIDYLRNGRGSTTVCAWSSRAKRGATASIPVSWQAIEEGLLPNAFSLTDMAAIEKRVTGPDPWAGFFEKGIALKA